MRLGPKKLHRLFRVGPSPIHGMGLFARARIRKGQYLGTYEGPRVNRNGSHVLWVYEGHGWTRRDGKNLLRFINHSSEPNAEFDGFDLYALRDIRPGEEITIDYGEDPGGD